MREDARLRQGLAECQGNGDHVPNRVDTGEPRLQRVTIDRDPPTLGDEPAVPDHARWPMRRDIRQQITLGDRPVGKREPPRRAVNGRHLVLWMVRNALRREQLFHRV